jgi:predicted nuclease of restriction endonuclease-like RecB superfamily
MFPSALLLARARKDGVRPVFLGEAALPQAEAVVKLYREGIGRSRRELELRVRELETKVDKYKVIRGLALLVERRCTFSAREGPPPAELRRRLFDEVKGPAVTPEERAAVLARVAPEVGLSPSALSDHLWADLEEEEVLRAVPPLDPGGLLRRFNLGQCQTLLFKATQMSLTFGEPEAYRTAVSRVKRRGLMFTAEAPVDGGSPVLLIEGVVSFLRSTERYGTRLAKILPDLLSLSGWTLSAKVLYRDSTGRKRHLDFKLDQGMAEYLDVPPEETDTPEYPSVLDAVATSAERAGIQVDRSPAPLAVGGGLEYPDLVLSRGKKRLFVEAVGYWSKEWLERKIQRTERAPGPYAVVAPRDLAVASAFEHPRLFVAGRGGLKLEQLKPLLPVPDLPREPPRRKVAPEELSIPLGSAFAIGEVARKNRVPPAQARELLESLGFVCAGGFALRREAMPEMREEIRKSLPELDSVESTLRRWDLPASVLFALGFSIKWNGLAGAIVRER